MGNQRKMSAKDKAFERERIKFHSMIRSKDDEINALKQEAIKYKADAEPWEKTARLLESYIGLPREKILEDIEKRARIDYVLKPVTSVIQRYL